MKILAACSLFVIVTLTAKAEANRSSLKAAITQVLKEKFVYDVSKATRPENSDDTDDVVALPAMVVTVQRDGSATAIAANRKKTEDEKFDWRNGGTILKKKGKHITSELRFSDNPGGGIEFLKFSW